jgi:hypothetical protein
MTDEQLRERFDRTFHGQPDLIVRSPGRVNLIGEHTDYNDGWALPIALGPRTAGPNPDRKTGLACAARLGPMPDPPHVLVTPGARASKWTARHFRRYGVGASSHNQLRGRAELGALRAAGGPSGGHAESKKLADAPAMTSVFRLAAGRPGRPAPASLRSARGR